MAAIMILFCGVSGCGFLQISVGDNRCSITSVLVCLGLRESCQLITESVEERQGLSSSVSHVEEDDDDLQEGRFIGDHSMPGSNSQDVDIRHIFRIMQGYHEQAVDR